MLPFFFSHLSDFYVCFNFIFIDLRDKIRIFDGAYSCHYDPKCLSNTRFVSGNNHAQIAQKHRVCAEKRTRGRAVLPRSAESSSASAQVSHPHTSKADMCEAARFAFTAWAPGTWKGFQPVISFPRRMHFTRRLAPRARKDAALAIPSPSTLAQLVGDKN